MFPSELVDTNRASNKCSCGFVTVLLCVMVWAHWTLNVTYVSVPSVTLLVLLRQGKQEWWRLCTQCLTAEAAEPDCSDPWAPSSASRNTQSLKLKTFIQSFWSCCSFSTLYKLITGVAVTCKLKIHQISNYFSVVGFTDVGFHLLKFSCQSNVRRSSFWILCCWSSALSRGGSDFIINHFTGKTVSNV